MRQWLSPLVFEWSGSVDGGELSPRARCDRPYEILAHCERILAASESEHSLADAVLGLKRVLNSRLQHLEELYGFRDLVRPRLGALETLERFGLARPFLVRQLFELRNDIEHNDARPPTAARIRELTDLVWYFLRATDPVCRMVPDGLELNRPDSDPVVQKQWVSVSKSHAVRDQYLITGWVSKNLISGEALHGFIELDLEDSGNASSGHREAVQTGNEVHRRSALPASGDLQWIEGNARFSSELQLKVWRLILAEL